jgi:FKBP-type peptidyl-prolyl cis-trans isomerase
VLTPFPLGPRTTAAVLLILGAACSSSSEPAGPPDPATETFAASLGVNIAQMTRKSSALYVQDLVVGTGTEATSGRSLRVTYTGWLANGTKFDSNVGQTALPFTLGVGQVISGWDQGVAGMRVGGKRRLVIGSTLGYGASGYGPIPPNSTLVFDVELLGVQ